MKIRSGIAAIGISFAVAFSFGSVTPAEAQKAAAAKPVVIKNACVYSTLLCPAVVMDAAGNRYDISGLKRPNANPVNVIGWTRPDGVFCGTRVAAGYVTPAKGVCILPFRLF